MRRMWVVLAVCLVAVSASAAVLFDEDFEGPGNLWGNTGMWHFAKKVGSANPATNNCLYYGRDDARRPNYDKGTVTSGFATVVGEIALNGVQSVVITFDSYRVVEYNRWATADITELEVRFNGRGGWRSVWKKDCKDKSICGWTHERATISTAGKETMTLRFGFNSKDKFGNQFLGWIVDNIVVESGS